METETLVTQFTCDRGGMICSRRAGPRRRTYRGIYERICRRLFDATLLVRDLCRVPTERYFHPRDCSSKFHNKNLPTR